MNNKRRRSLRESIYYLNKASELISSVSFGEQDCLDSMPENLSSSERCLKMEDNIEEIIRDIESVIEWGDMYGWIYGYVYIFCGRFVYIR